MATPPKKVPSLAKKTPLAGKKGASNVRIIAGQWRGRVLPFPSIEGLRPTGNRIRETLFNWLMPVLPGSQCLDAFSGSGALGFEALSRGASAVTLLEPNALANQQLHANAAQLQAQNCSIYGSRAEQWLAAPAHTAFNVVFIDPPFALDLWPDVLGKLETNGWLASAAWVYIETPKNYPLSVPAHWQNHRSKQAGNVTFALYQRQTPLI